MRGKDLIKKIIIVLVVAWALYALYPTYRIMTMKPKKQTQLEDQGKYVPLRKKSIKMGLDLAGGMYLMYEVDFAQLVEQLARNQDDRLNELMQKTREDMNVTAEDFLTVLTRNFHEAGIPLSRYWGERGESDAKVLDELGKQATQALDRSLQKLRNRVDQFGVSEPNIQKQRDRRILIELPGVSDPERAKELIGKTALLEFKLAKEPAEYKDVITRIDQLLARERGIKVKEETDTAAVAAQDSEGVTPKQREEKVISVSELFGEEEVTGQEDTTKAAGRDTSLFVDSDMFEKNPFQALLVNIQRRGHDVSVPIENMRAVDRILARPEVQALIPQDAQFMWGSETFKVADREFRDLYLLNKETELTGRYLTDARVSIGSDAQSAGLPEVHFTLNRQGGRIFGRVTGANINKSLAIVLDNRVVSAPRIASKLSTYSRITGIQEMSEAQMISIVLRVGALDAPIQIVEERTVGPSLGKDSIRNGTYAAVIGLGIVILFMVVYYRMSGMIASLALIMNLVLLMATLAQFGFTLTLPGVAGIVLTIGMAVDANVLIFERIREELKTGKTVRASIDAGYSRAFGAIFDSNITTLLTAIILYQIGSGPVRGFGVTLAIGIAVSMFTALTVTHVIFNTITARRTITTLSI